MPCRALLLVTLTAAAGTTRASGAGAESDLAPLEEPVEESIETPTVVVTPPPEAVRSPPPFDPALAGPPGPLPDIPAASPRPDGTAHAFSILGQWVEPGELRQFNWQLDTAMAGLAVPTPVLVAHGRRPGPTLCLVAAVHGDELNGVEIVRRIMFNLDRDKLAGSVVGIPIANAFGFLRRSRYLPDRRDLNRFFPGTATGSMASRFAHAMFDAVVRRCDVLVDIHTGSFNRTNLPQLRADLTIEPVLELTRQFGDIAVLHSDGPEGSLRRAATDVGIPAVTLEAGGPSRFQSSAVDAGVTAIEALLNHLDMIQRFRLFGEPQPVFYDSTWVRAESGGILLSEVRLGAIVETDQRLATVTDPIENQRETLHAPFRGRILGMAVNQVVMPGFAAFHIGRVASEEEAVEATADEVADDAEHAEDPDITSPEDEHPEPVGGEPEPGEAPDPPPDDEEPDSDG